MTIWDCFAVATDNETADNARFRARHCETVVTPGGLVRECIDPELRRITRETLGGRDGGYGCRVLITPDGPVVKCVDVEPYWTPELQDNAERAVRLWNDRVAIEAQGFVLAYERPL